MALRAAGQAIMLILLTRLLGANGYGQFVAPLAIATFFAPMAGMGVQGILLRDGARHPEQLPSMLGEALAIWVRGTAFFGAAGVVVTGLALPRNTDLAPMAALVLAEIASSSLVELLARVAQSQHRVTLYGALMAGLMLARLAALLGYVLLLLPSSQGWMWVYAASSAVYALCALRWAKHAYAPVWPAKLRPALARQGFPFALGALSMRLQAEFNKPVLARLGYALAGNYSAAQRAVDAATLPLQALQDALWPRLYARGGQARHMVLTGAMIMGLGITGSTALTLAAPLLPRLLGPGFESAVHLLRLLAWLPTLQIVRNFSNVYVTARHRTHILTWAYLAGGGVSMVSTTVLATIYGSNGAVAATYLTEFIIIALLLTLATQKPMEPT